MPNTSATGGYLTPTNTPLDDQALDRVIHDLYAGITGLSASLVRPRWQQEPGNMPALGSTWIAHGITERRNDIIDSQTYIEGTGIIVNREQELDSLVSCYGTRAAEIEALLRDGLGIAQNREAIDALGLSYISISSCRNVTMLINQRWSIRLDVTVTFRRRISHIYPVLSLQSGYITEHVESFVDNIIVTP